jgi:tocopherol O-methyltransferase
MSVKEESPAFPHDVGDDVGAKYSAGPPSPFTSFDALKGRIREHYEVCSDYYYSLWQAT